MTARKPATGGQSLKRLNFDVPEDLAHEFKAYAALQGKTQREIVIAFMERCVRRNHPDPAGRPVAPTTNDPTGRREGGA
ncbi:hypothetical protein [Arthrobacter sp. KK5.5]|uniref:hypothetical protein n=1 Tax=Arthrobacter sp. KK5.5 TaxID=3373084 RepID=UPI003EE48A8F